MSNLSETQVWEAGIYQLEETDVVQGGPNGIDNLQGKQLANRTAWLKQQVEAAQASAAGKLATAAKSSTPQAIAGADDATWMTPLKTAEAIAASGGVGAASETVSGVVELATHAETVTGTDVVRATHPAGVKAAIAAAIAALVNSSPSALDTLNELASALGNDPNFAASMTASLAGKAAIATSNLWSKAQAPVSSNLIDGASIAWDCSVTQVGKIILAGNRTMAAPSNVQENALYILRVTQDATGSRVLSWNAAYKFGAAGAPTLTTTAGKTDFLSFMGGAGNTLEFLGYRLNGV